jgi:hypothetical protein
MCRLDFATMVDDLALLIDERLAMLAAALRAAMVDIYLCNVERSSVSLAVTKNAEDTRILNCGTDSVHLFKVLLHGVMEVLVHECGIVDRNLVKDIP